MRVIGITGGVGAGKSAVLKYLKAIPVVRVLEADQVGHLLMEPGTECFQRIREHFGERVIAEDGSLDRAAVARIIFSDKKELEWQNALMHPAIKEWIRQEIRLERQQGTCKLFVVEAALLIEDHYEDLCEAFWYLYTRPELRRERLKESRGYSDEKIDSIFARQRTDTEFRSHCREVIDNNGTKEELYGQIDLLLQKLGIETDTKEQTAT
ncbi:dephospho-CoA kinase [Candidatus Merdisoma sp. HCP28S3_D10]|uniref:dephospho-CoA kinase n=1 Tax=unclassified Candidatus Merdisoma TaxID=3099611 RepID=UPI003F892A45